MIPTTGSPSTTTPMSVVYSGTPWMNDLVPSMGSKIHCIELSSFVRRALLQ